MKTIIASVLMTCSISAFAGELTADSNLAIGANTILAKFTRVTEVPAGEIPNVDKSLAIGARSILGIFERVTEVSSDNVPSVDASKNAFVDGVLNRDAGYQIKSKIIQANVEQPPLTN